ncbi:MAG: hypothetical protein MPJ24_09065, partial [Pirellulaceae bacterium]|nr:hypothetical protein [Pirellulaceae bacterium]
MKAMLRFPRISQRLLWGHVFVAMLAVSGVVKADNGNDDNAVRANFKQAYKYNSSYLRQLQYSTSVTPHFVGKSGKFWYDYKTSDGTYWYLVDPSKKTKTFLFDRVDVAEQVSAAVEQPLEAQIMVLSNVKVDDKIA